MGGVTAVIRLKLDRLSRQLSPSDSRPVAVAGELVNGALDHSAVLFRWRSGYNLALALEDE